MGFIHSVVHQAEISEATAQQKNWKGIIIAVLVICFVLALIVVAIFLVSPKKSEASIGESFTIDEVFGGEFDHRRFDVHWLPDKNVYLYRSADNELVEFDADRNLSELVLSNSTFRELNADVYLPSPDHSYILIAYEVEKVGRNSLRARYKIYHRYAKSHKTRFINFPQGNPCEHRKIDLVTWSPNSQSLSFSCGRRLFIQTDPLTSPTEVPRSKSEEPNPYVYYGIANAFYEEEILGSSVAHWWSAQGTYICYLVIDDSKVPIRKYPIYGGTETFESIIVETSYPTAGLTGDGQLPTVGVFVFPVSESDASSVHLRPPNRLEKTDHYVTNVAWADDAHLAVVWLNRPHDLSIVVFCEAKTGHCAENLVETAQEGRDWLSPLPVMRFIDNTQTPHTLLTISSKRDGSAGFWRHVALVSLSLSGSGVRFFLTEGLWEATDIVGFDSETSSVFYIATNLDPRSRHLFRVTLPTSAGRLHVPVCLTCQLDDGCQYVTASFSQSGKYYVLHCLGPDIPRYALRNTFDDNEMVVEDNSQIRAALSEKALPTKEFYEVDLDDGQKAWVEVLLPPQLQKEQIYIYPVVVLIGEWPGDQLVTWQHQIDFATYLSSAEGVIVVKVDGRGSAGRGDRWRHSIYRKLGTIDLSDQIRAARFVRDSFHYIDKDRITVWGKSYGGYLAIKALGNDSNLFKCGVAVSPVTNWRYQSTFTAERYLGLVHDDSTTNYKNYNDAKVTVRPELYRGKHLLLIHGTADERVHFEHTAQLIKLLTNADADFNVQLYTDEPHSLGGVLRHMHQATTKFWKVYCWNGGRRRELGKTSKTNTDEQEHC